MLFLKQLVKLLVLSSADLLHRTSHTKIFLLHAIFYLSIQCLPKVLSLHCIVPMPMFLSPVTHCSVKIPLSIPLDAKIHEGSSQITLDVAAIEAAPFNL